MGQRGQFNLNKICLTVQEVVDVKVTAVRITPLETNFWKTWANLDDAD